ncbi:MAG: type IV pilus twitching motility protein PilT [Patescibacteria group bacterium]
MHINDLLQITCESNASDLHLIVGQPPVVRINGELKRLENQMVLEKKGIEELIFSLLTPVQKEKFFAERELDISYGINKIGRFRINLHFEKNNIGLAARVIPNKIPTMEDILMPPITYELTRSSKGLILITGPTGCGKSTTLAAMVDLINSERTCNIITLEDPIEFLFESKKSLIRQRQLGTDMLSFNTALKHTLRQDPDIIMVGEMRDLETIAATITLAETGHLVLGTLHTYNAAQTVDRIIDIFPPYQQGQIRTQLSMVLTAVISQQLLPTLNKNGQISAREILINTPAIANLIRENKIAQIKTVIQTGMRDQMISMDQDLKRLYKEGLISKENAQIRMENPEFLIN